MVEINPDKQIKLLPVIIAIVIIFSIFIAYFVYYEIKDPEHDLLNASALVLEAGIGLIISWTVYVYSKKWKVENDKVISNIKKITNDLGQLIKNIHDSSQEQKKLLTDTREFYASVFVGYFRLMSTNYGYVINLYETNFIGNSNFMLKREITDKLCRYYDDHLINHLPKIEAIELVKVFGKDIANKYWTHTTKLTSDMWQPYTDKGMELMMNAYKEEMFKMMELKNTFLSFCDVSFRENDSKFQENYDLIKKTSLKE